MGISIKNSQTERLIRELAHLTGESQTAAITEAVKQRLEKLRTRRDLAEELLAIGRETAPLFKEPFKSVDHGDLLYDKETGLPR